MTRFLRHTAKPSIRQRAIRIATVLFYLALFTTIAWTAADRWNDVPADPSNPAYSGSPYARKIDPSRDRTAELMEALNLLPPGPTISLPPPPEGKRWVQTTTAYDIFDSLYGAWSPKTRPTQRALVEYLESKEARDALNRIIEIRQGAARFDVLGGYSPIRRVAKLLVACSRYHHDEKHDFDAALRDLEGLFRLSTLLYESGATISVLVGSACESIGHAELRRIVHDHALAPNEQVAVIEMLDRTTFPDSLLWPTIVANEIGYARRTLDMAYSNDGSGDGRLVLTHLQETGSWTRPNEVRCGAWNILSVFFNNRRTVAGKLDRLGAMLSGDQGLTYQEAFAGVRTIERNSEFNTLDGPLMEFSLFQYRSGMLRGITQLIANRRASHTTVALSAFRQCRGLYPTTLVELAPAYVKALLLDPFSGEPLRYWREGECDFRLYSVGPNGQDNNGFYEVRSGTESKPNEHDDRLFRHNRAEPSAEPYLEDVPQ